MGLSKIILPAYSSLCGFNLGPLLTSAAQDGDGNKSTELHLHQTPDSGFCFYQRFREFCFKLPVNPHVASQSKVKTCPRVVSHMPYLIKKKVRLCSSVKWVFRALRYEGLGQDDAPDISPPLSPENTVAGESSASACSGSSPSVLSPIQMWDSGSAFLTVSP